MQSVGAPNAKDIDLVLSPSSVVFQTGAQYIVNTLSSAVAVSTSLGDCESEEVEDDGGINTVRERRLSDAQGRQAGARRRARRGSLRQETTGRTTAPTTRATRRTASAAGMRRSTSPARSPRSSAWGERSSRRRGTGTRPAALTAWQAEEVWNEGSHRRSGRRRAEPALPEADLADRGRPEGERRRARRA